MNEMIVQIKEASIEQKPVLERLYQLYLYDFSEFEGSDVNQDALFEYKYLDHYWIEPGRFPFLIYVEGKIAGFVLVKSHTFLQENRESRTIAEFFVQFRKTSEAPVVGERSEHAQVPKAKHRQDGGFLHFRQVSGEVGSPTNEYEHSRSKILGKCY